MNQNLKKTYNDLVHGAYNRTHSSAGSKYPQQNTPGLSPIVMQWQIKILPATQFKHVLEMFNDPKNGSIGEYTKVNTCPY